MLLSTLGNKIKETRNSTGISQNQLSELTGIAREQISRIENGQINPTILTLAKISEALEITLPNLLNFKFENVKYKKYRIKPFVKWAGGKTQLIDKIKIYMPKQYNTYYEPFLGGGALFFHLMPEEAVVSDFNEELINSYRCFQDINDFSLMIEEILKHQKLHNEEYYYQVRAMDRQYNYRKLPRYVQAARLIYLNKACFNGLYRVNSKGYFNVPFGKKEVVNAYDQELFDNIHEYLSNPKIKITQGDFEKTVESAKSGDFVYFDPPYDPFENQNNFTTYTENSFGKAEQKRLADVFKQLHSKGVYVMLSNHNTEFIRSLYSEFNINIIQARRNINSKGTSRGFVEEVIITNYK